MYYAQLFSSFMSPLTIKMACIDEKSLRVDVTLDDYSEVILKDLYTVNYF